ncbi:sugar ABC transporter ATP-binding protein [Paenarthrobacter sp. JL.01a]|uniref:sugar ABC transporter ATP-binding protein n=1 Tax=Paenarthrobacter sp. JL.01a TaxID=2979324 RepID=UPI0021C9BE4E|nr:sugar ABC transporter ATP-binding protein [Paenarthrobacter sp. JL.01a]UXM92462.1 sugar ABC transporter ATP-binding protein [Paenarthrobacter sp. JL.01a]
MNTADNVVEMRSISKAFNGVSVLKDVGFDVRKGEVHALAGGNGAGKSTLMKILQGVYQADAGEILIAGKPAAINSIQDAKSAGIGMVFQEFSLVPSLTVAQNIFLGTEPLGRGGLIDDRAAVRRANEVFAEMEVDVDAGAQVSRLGTAYWQLTEIAKALSQNAQVLIMDEPTASLARHESEALFELIDRLKQRGISIIYISHRMDEVYRLADRITILRDGKHLLTKPLTGVTPEQIVEGIVGKKVDGELSYRARNTIRHDDEPLLEVRGLNAGQRVRDVSFALRPGEILGLAGLMGSGRTELARALFGIDKPDSGQVLIRGRKVALASPQQAIDAGIALVPEDRRAQGLVLEHSVQDNLLLPLLKNIQRGPLLDGAKGNELSTSLIKRFAVKVAHPHRPVRLLSGGNQQKVVIAKWLGTNPDILILDEPTAGVDIGTKSEILDMIRELASDGKAIIVISSEYPELLAVSDRVLVLKDGSIIRDIPRSDIADEEYLQLAVQGV